MVIPNVINAAIFVSEDNGSQSPAQYTDTRILMSFTECQVLRDYEVGDHMNLSLLVY